MLDKIRRINRGNRDAGGCSTAIKLAEQKRAREQRREQVKNEREKKF